jgi:PPIC-type PPIASE domain
MKKNILIIAVIFGVTISGVFLWRFLDTTAKANLNKTESLTKLSADDINLILGTHKDGGKDGVSNITQSDESRKLFLKGLREYLALAAQAKTEGLDGDASFRINFEYKKNGLLADLYKEKLTKELGNPYQLSKEEVESVWQNSENQKQFDIDIETLRQIQIQVGKERGGQTNIPKPQGGALEKTRENWATAKILSDRAKADLEFMSKPELNLRIRILEAGILSADYLRKHWSESVKATPQEITAYLTAHPEYNLEAKLEKAKSLLKRVQAGEDFAKLATENSEDRPTKIKGGLYENINTDFIWKEVETAALALEKGQVANELVETQTGYHIVRLENKKVTKEADGREKVVFSVRHILLQKAFEEPGNTNPEVPSPFMQPDEIAKGVIEREKRNALVSKIIKANEISLPDEFANESKNL